jgi:hypothetical protein
MTDDSKGCRPKKLTCRWLQEITHAIHIACPNQPKITHCSQDLEKAWELYKLKLGQSCQGNKTVKQILNYEIDYNDVAVPILDSELSSVNKPTDQ